MNTSAPIKPVLVTGAPRSGTTWLGRMLTIDPALYYVHEPFNPLVKASEELYGLRIPPYFIHICADNGMDYRAAVQRLIDGRYDWQHGLGAARSPGDLSKVIRNLLAVRKLRGNGGRPLIKDPIALMSAEWLSDQFDMNCIVMIRHPAAFVASMKRLGWASHPEKWALSQPLLMRDYLGPFEQRIKAMSGSEHDLVERASLAWTMHHHVISLYRKRHPEWTFVRHEDISLDPVQSFADLYKKLGLPYTDKARSVIAEHTGKSNPERASGTEKTLKLDSAQNISSWKHRLSGEEILRIRGYVEDVAREFYSDADWDLGQSATA
ncbi:MAG: sulfotransferase [Gammaproteobacteria bacterium]|nr:sulfotransferase [Gammaproteobacteria bacterium]